MNVESIKIRLEEHKRITASGCWEWDRLYWKSWLWNNIRR